MKPSSNKLFHVLVVVGASMTGAVAACGGQATGTINPEALRDASADGKGSDAPYGTISAPDAYGYDSYVGIIGNGPPDAGLDARDDADSYAPIMPNPCAPFSPGMCPPDSGGDSSGDADAYPNITPLPGGDF